MTISKIQSRRSTNYPPGCTVFSIFIPTRVNLQINIIDDHCDNAFTVDDTFIATTLSLLTIPSLLTTHTTKNAQCIIWWRFTYTTAHACQWWRTIFCTIWWITLPSISNRTTKSMTGRALDGKLSHLLPKLHAFITDVSFLTYAPLCVQNLLLFPSALHSLRPFINIDSLPYWGTYQPLLPHEISFTDTTRVELPTLNCVPFATP